MPNQDAAASHARAKALETDNHMQGRSGADTQKNAGPASKRGVLPTNPVSGGGINRSTKRPAGASD